jgi:superfamily I DNA/RNA helicase/CRISPR/Cas system-associated exonuclease Cas4 (RecB family)
MRSPNPEQKKAICHTGGVLLNAGAGSGKTFVLIEHIHYLISEFINKRIDLPTEIFKKELKNYLNKIVLMTFTNDAAAEIRERLFKRFENLEEGHWAIVPDCLTAMNVSTIHGFCLKMIKQGLIEGAPGQIEITDEFQISKKIEILVEQWFERNSDSELSDSFIKNYNSIVKAMQFIFSSPELRAEWAAGIKYSADNFDEPKFWGELFDLLEISEFWKTKTDLSEVDEFAGKSWYELLKGINAIKDKGSVSYNDLLEIDHLFKTVGRLVVSKKVSQDIRDQVNEAKKIKDFMKSYGEDLGYFFSHRDIFKTWESSFKNLFDYIDSRYYDIAGIGFSDLEYLVLRALRDSETTREQVRNNFNYLIVDEFQDTSWVQFEIIKHAIGDNFNKLFCVGDRKQAIYGFRGGELGVFNETSEKVPQNLIMSNNYRSEESVVKFNNKFFDYIFKLGREYSGHDSYSVHVDYQDFPSDVKEAGHGCVTQFNLAVEDEEIKRPSPVNMNKWEAMGLFNRIQSIQKESPDEEICILYKNLGPSKILIEQLIKENIPFQAQVKVPYAEDPFMAIFSAFIDFLLEVEKAPSEQLHWDKCAKYFNFYLDGISRHYFSEVQSVSQEVLRENFYKYKQSGVEVSFWSLVFEMGFANSSYDNNSKKIGEIIKSSSGSISDIWKVLDTLSGQNYSTKFNYLKNPKVFIMTTHASKGLQYDQVLLGGVHTNGRRVANTETMGMLPGSFRWSSNLLKKKLHRSPMYIYENILKSHKEYSESKRLFYVACTRAVNGIEWVNVTLNGKELSSSKESWVNALRIFHDESFTDSTLSIDIDNSINPSKAPMYFIDPLGLSGRDEKMKIGLVSELSVTKLSLLAMCPKKFYLSQILKLDEQWDEFCETNEIEKPTRVGISDADRGTRLHYQIEKLIKGLSVDSSEKEILDWVRKEISHINKDDLISEAEIKFSFFGQMITGIPDLVVKSDGLIKEIWDFKSGLCDEDDFRSYKFQLMTYAYGLSQVYGDMADTITMKLLLLDQKEVKSFELDLKTISKELYKTWQSLSGIQVEKINHCAQCQYGNLCHQ